MMKPTLAVLAFTVLTAATGAAHANGNPSSDGMGACTTVVQYPLAIEAQNQNQRNGSSLWLSGFTTSHLELKAWMGTGYKVIAHGKGEPYLAPAWKNSIVLESNSPRTAAKPISLSLPPCVPPTVPTGYLRVNDGKGSAELFYLDQRVGAGSDLFVSPAVGWGVDERGVYFQGALVIGSEQFCKLVDGICSGKLDAATITATAQSIAQQVLQDWFAVVHVLGHQVWVQPMVADDFGRRNESAADVFSHRVNQLYRKRHSAASSAMRRDSGRIVLNPVGRLGSNLVDNQSFYMGDAGLYYQNRLVEPLEQGRNLPALEWRLLQNTFTGPNEGIATAAQVFLSGHSGQPVEGADAISFKIINPGYGRDAHRYFHGSKPLLGVSSDTNTRSPLSSKNFEGVNFPAMYHMNPDLFWIAGVPHTVLGGVLRLKRLHGAQNMLTDDIFVYDMQGLRYAVADVVPYVCDTLHLQAAPPNAYLKATRQGAEPAFYSWQGQRITHPLDLAAIQAAKCQRND